MMIEASTIQKLKDILFIEDNFTYAILDSAISDDVWLNVKEIFNPEYLCLYTGEDEEDLETAAPYLVKLVKDSEFSDWVLENYGSNRGIFFQSPHSIQEAHAELSPRAKIIDEDTEQNMFVRFYDPRAIYKYLKMQTLEQAQALFAVTPVLFYENHKNPVELFKVISKDEQFFTDRISLEQIA